MPLGTVYVGEESPRAGAEPVFGYRLLRRLGSGGHGEVWRAEAPGGFQVAMKFIRLEKGLGAAEARTLEILRGLRHPNLLLTFGAWEVPGYLVLGMELADRTLWDRLNECTDGGLPGIPREELIEYLAETAKGIDYLNEPGSGLEGEGRPGIQHRDLKPQNILLAGGGVKVGDFGLARQLDRSLASHTGHWTFAYAAPEFFRRQTSGHSDQYSLAATYCHLRGGRPPFGGPAAVIMAGHLLLPPDLTMIPEAERPVVARALAKVPKDRWPSCRAFVAALREARPVDAPVSVIIPARPPRELVPAAGEVPDLAEFASSEEIEIRTPFPTAPVAPQAEPPDPTQWTTKIFDDEFADIPEVLAVALDSHPDDDLHGIVKAPPAWGDPEAGRFESEGLLAVLNEPMPRRRPGRFLRAGLVAAVAMAGGVGLWAVGAIPLPGLRPLPEDVDRVEVPGPRPPVQATVASPEPAAPTDKAVERAAVPEGKARPTLVSAPVVEDPAAGPPLVPPLEAEPFGIAVPPGVIAVRPGDGGRFDVQVRRAGTSGAVALTLEGAPAGVSLEPAVVPEGQESARVAIKAGPKVDAGAHTARLVARAGEASAEAVLSLDVEPARHAPRVTLSAPPTVAIRAGRAVRLPIGVARDGFAGPIAVHFEGLPEGVRATPATLPAGEDRAEARLTAGPGAPGGERVARLVAEVGAGRVEVPVTVLVEPDRARPLIARARLLLSLGQLDEAAANLDEALRLDPELTHAYVLRGTIFVEMKEFERAIVDFKEAIRRNKDDAVALNNCGRAYSGRGDYFQAICQYNEAILLNPRNAVMRYNRGVAYHLTRDEQMALEDLTKAIELDPNQASFFEERAEVLDKLNEPARARQDRERARALGPSPGRGRSIRTIPGPARGGKAAGTKRAARVVTGAAGSTRPG